MYSLSEGPLMCMAPGHLPSEGVQVRSYRTSHVRTSKFLKGRKTIEKRLQNMNKMVVSTVSSVSTDLFGSPGYQPWTWPHLATRSWWGRFLPEPARLSHTQSSILLTQTKQYNGWMQNYQNYQIIRLFKFFQVQRLRLLVLKKVVHPQKKNNRLCCF